MSPTPCPNTGTLRPHRGRMLIGRFTSPRVSPGRPHCVIPFIRGCGWTEVSLSRTCFFAIRPYHQACSDPPVHRSSLQESSRLGSIRSTHTDMNRRAAYPVFKDRPGISPFISLVWTENGIWLRYFAKFFNFFHFTVTKSENLSTPERWKTFLM